MQIPIRKSFFSALVLSWLLVVAVAVRADEVPYSPDLPTNTVCLVQIAQLHPTQFALGLKEVEERAEKFKALKEAKREAYLHKHIAPIAIGPGGIPYILDGQHLARIVLESGAKPEMYVEVKQN